MSTSLSNLVDNLSGVYDKGCKKCMEKKLGWIVNLLDGTLNYKCKECKKS